MSRVSRHLTFVLGAALLVAPAFIAPALAAQPGPGAGDRPSQGASPRGRSAAGVTQLLNARRELELTPRQVAQLDSIERVQMAEHKALNERLRPVRDSIAQRVRSGDRTPEFRDSIRAQARSRMEANRPLLDEQRKRDSSRHVAAERVMNDTQRQRVREMQAERRGFERGMREGRGQRGGASVRGDRGGMRGGMSRPQGGQSGPAGVRGPQGPGARGGRGGMPPRPPVDRDSNDR